MVNPSKIAGRDELRSNLRSRRRSLSPAEQTLAAQNLKIRVAGYRLFRVSRRIAFYLANDGEIDTGPLLDFALRNNKSCYLPILSRVQSDRLWFAPYRPGVALSQNRFGILEPVVPARLWVRANVLDLVFLPLVAFDDQGNRLGMGGGFYDKSLAFLRSRRCWRRPHTIGLAHDFQQVAKLEPRPWDIPIQAILTNNAVHTCPSSTIEVKP